VVAPDHVFNTWEGCAAVSDASGSLLFYTDGDQLYDAAGTFIHSTPPAPLGGTSSSAHAAIIVPPAGGGSLYHIFAVGDWDGTSSMGPVTHTTVSVASGIAIPPPPPTDLTTLGPQLAAEKLAAIPHHDCKKYWVVAFDGVTVGPGSLHAILVDSDAAPTTTVVSPYATSPGFCVKFSPDGSLIAVTSTDTIDILSFDRSTGLATPHSQITQFAYTDRAYGVEFSPNGKYLYFTGFLSGDIRRHTIGASGTSALFSSTTLVGQWTVQGRGTYRVGALQLAPNGRIYGTKVTQTTLFEIAAPDHPTNVQFNPVAQAGSGGPLTLPHQADLGLPTFTRIADDCREAPPAEDRCAKLAAEVEELLASHELHNSMLTCKGEAPGDPRCEPLDIPLLQPQVYIRWGDSKCDCIEGDDTEVMHLTVCNPYRNFTLSNLVVSQLIVVDGNGNPVPNLPNGDPSVELVPIGPYCFDDIAPCTCVTREFVLWLRGAPGGTYHIEVKGICFDACFHGDADACFQFEVCKD
jgi:hypothetical protein